jgi:hypothetical protein
MQTAHNPNPKPDAKSKAAELDKLLLDLTRVRGELSDAFTVFNRAVQPEAIDASVFAISALNAHYGVVLRKIKALQPRSADDSGNLSDQSASTIPQKSSNVKRQFTTPLPFR